MRGKDLETGSLFGCVDLEARVPKDHPPRRMAEIVNDVLQDLPPGSSAMHSSIGRPSTAPGKLLRALLLQAFHPVRCERRLMEQLDFNLPCRWFAGLGIDDVVWDATVSCQNRDRPSDGQVSHEFPRGIITHRRVRRLSSTDHFPVDGTLIDARASMKSPVPRDDGERDDDERCAQGRREGRNGERDVRGTGRRNDTHASLTDPQARLHRKGKGKSAHLRFMGNALMENRHGLAVAATVNCATGTAGREAAPALVDSLQPASGATPGAGKAHDAWRFKADLQERGVVAHMAGRADRSWGSLPVVDPPGHRSSQRARKRIEEIFAWVKTTWVKTTWVKTIAGQSGTGTSSTSWSLPASCLPNAGVILPAVPQPVEWIGDTASAMHPSHGPETTKWTRHQDQVRHSSKTMTPSQPCYSPTMVMKLNPRPPNCSSSAAC